MNIRIPEDDITSESFIVQWDAVAVNDIFPVTYTVRWYGEDGSNGTASVTGLSFTITGLTANTSYNVTVVAVNTCCGEGPVSDVVMVMTNNHSPTLPPPTVPTATAPTANATTATATTANATDTTSTATTATDTTANATDTTSTATTATDTTTATATTVNDTTPTPMSGNITSTTPTPTSGNITMLLLCMQQ